MVQFKEKSEGVWGIAGLHFPPLNLHCNSPKIFVYQNPRFVLSTLVLLWFGHVSSIIIPQHKSTSLLVYSFKGHQDWTTLSGIKGVSKFTLAMMNNPVDLGWDWENAAFIMEMRLERQLRNFQWRTFSARLIQTHFRYQITNPAREPCTIILHRIIFD